ncbi:hypothetical protein ART_1281 [Arthrobacter sp. PAMC 25486]|uniref:hypothetical protein n=1 Tax=Arthrobacter sp. PAMC 25486 TaxID=1494608 RepID=UPI000535AD17|nr:hypothetical protein [Arthrobacter sp. PAMC 25486]AIY00880.1 hypothetical protein ART_1281 [Arthrobacter sp. PAMC 25486]
MSAASPVVSVGEPGFSDDGRLSLDIVTAHGVKHLFFDMHDAGMPSFDSIASTVGLLLGRGNAGINFGFPVSARTLEAVAAHCRCEVRSAKVATAVRHPASSRVGLAFSGGFDSLMARDLLPAGTALLSLDFGGRFARERAMFSAFDSHVVGTNLVDIGLNRNSWSFMAAANVLLRDSLGLATLSFGTVTEARPKYFRFGGQTQPVGSTMDAVTEMPIFNPVLGLTEVATARYALTHYPARVDDILKSVANPGEEKAYRKQLLLLAANAHAGNAVAPPADALPAQPILTWGSSLAADFLSLYLMKHLGAGVVQKLYKQPVPDAAKLLVDKLELNFFGRVNANFYQGHDRSLQSGMYRKLLLAGVEPYGSQDFHEFAQVAALLG